MKYNALTPKKFAIATEAKICVFDIETIRWIEPYALGFYDGKNLAIYEGKECIKRFVDEFLTHKYRGWIAYAHNGGKFDFNFILKELCRKQYIEKFTLFPMRIGSRIIEIKILKDKHVWILRDSYALLPFGLKKLTESFKVEALKGDFDHESINWKNWQKLKPEWQPYLINDVKGLYQVINKYEDYLLENYKQSLINVVTIAQLAKQVYRTGFLNTILPCYQSREDDIRQSYYGGRTEIFRLYGKDLRYYDVNSLYPHVMKKFPMPTGTPLKSYAMTAKDFGVAYARIRAPERLEYPVLPYRTKEKKLIFPLGEWKGWYCTPELKKAEELGYNIDIEVGYKFKQEHIFTDYVDHFYKIKESAKKSDPVAYINAKLMMNSLYGKFGQRRKQEQLIMFPKRVVGLEPVDFFGDLPIYIRKSESEAKHILPAIASFVTCYARLELYSHFEKVIDQGKHIYYCDTDSVVTDGKLPDSERLGDLSLEIPNIDQAIFLLPKMYAIKTKEGEIIKCKGFPKNLFDFKIFEQAYRSNDLTILNYEKKKFATPFESIRRNKTFVSMINFSRRVISKYDKREVINMIDTYPRVIKESI